MADAIDVGELCGAIVDSLDRVAAGVAFVITPTGCRDR